MENIIEESIKYIPLFESQVKDIAKIAWKEYMVEMVSESVFREHFYDYSEKIKKEPIDKNVYKKLEKEFIDFVRSIWFGESIKRTVDLSKAMSSITTKGRNVIRAFINHWADSFFNKKGMK